MTVHCRWKQTASPHEECGEDARLRSVQMETIIGKSIGEVVRPDDSDAH